MIGYIYVAIAAGGPDLLGQNFQNSIVNPCPVCRGTGLGDC